MTRTRIGWSEYFMRIAHEVAARSTCDRKHVGVVLVRDRHIIATGYNGSVPGAPHCDDVGHDIAGAYCEGCSGLEANVAKAPCPGDALGRHKFVGGNCVRTVHAEINAVAQAARLGLALSGSSAYVNTFPCWPCFKAIVSAGVVGVYYDDEYRLDERVLVCAKDSGVALHGPKAWMPSAPL